jgi:hypothetical protein
MSRPIVRIHNAETDEIIDREMNDDEFAIYEAQQLAIQKELEAKEEAAAKRQALLERLGITEEEARLLLA